MFSLWNINKKRDVRYNVFMREKEKCVSLEIVKLKYGKKNVSKGEKSRKQEKTRKQKLK